MYGIDFRDLAAVEGFCAWLRTKLARLDILINNACQTIRRPAQYYEHLMPAERRRLDELPAPVQQVLAGHDALRAANEGASRPAAIAAGSGADLPPTFVELLDPAAEPAAGATADTEPVRGPDKPARTVGTSGMGRGVGRADEVPAAAPPLDPAPTVARRAGNPGAGGGGSAAAEMSQLVVLPEDAADRPDLFPQRADGGGALVDVNAQQVDLRRHNSWMLKLHEVAPPDPPPTRVAASQSCRQLVLVWGPVMHSSLRVHDDDRTGSSYSLRALARPPLLSVGRTVDPEPDLPSPPPSRPSCRTPPQVSTGELVEVMAINAIAPAILNARLKPLLEVHTGARNGREDSGDGVDEGLGRVPARGSLDGRGMRRAAALRALLRRLSLSLTLPAAAAAAAAGVQASPEDWTFIVNVSAMEGKFYRWKTEQASPAPRPAVVLSRALEWRCGRARARGSGSDCCR